MKDRDCWLPSPCPDSTRSSGGTTKCEIILLCVRWYLTYPLSYRQVAEIVNERGLDVHHTTVFRWVQKYAPELDKRCPTGKQSPTEEGPPAALSHRPHLRPTNDSWRVDETYVKIKCKDRYLYRAVDSLGKTIDFLLTAHRDAEAAKRFLRKAMSATHNSRPRVINVDKNAAIPKAMDELKQKEELSKVVELRQNKYLNNRIEQDHRFIKRLVKPEMGFGSFNTARRTIQGYEIMNMLRKGQVKIVEKGAVRERVKFMAEIFGVAA